MCLEMLSRVAFVTQWRVWQPQGSTYYALHLSPYQLTQHGRTTPEIFQLARPWSNFLLHDDICTTLAMVMLRVGWCYPF